MSNHITDDPLKRYYVVRHSDSESGEHVHGLVEGIPDPEKPHDPGKDRKDGPPLITGVGADFWTAVNMADIVWVERSFKRYWHYNPSAAKKSREAGL